MEIQRKSVDQNYFSQLIENIICHAIITIVDAALDLALDVPKSDIFPLMKSVRRTLSGF
jgi:hypothetical protein